LAPSRVYLGVDGDAISLMATGVVGDDGSDGRVAALFDTHHQRLYRLARRLAASADEARDLVQETFLRVARRPEVVPRGASGEEAWLVRVLVNIARDGWRRRAVQRGYRERHAGAEATGRVPSPEDAFIARRTVWTALLQLDPRRRAVMVLHELEGVAPPDIARLLGVAAVTVRWHLSRGRRELAQIVEGKVSQ
jgi:RNA polymerase sigma factor (sigma-70 family)